MAMQGVKSPDANINKLATVLQDSFRSMALRMNEAGAMIEFQNDFTIRQLHNPTLLRKAGFQKWLRDTLPLLDTKKITDYLAGLSAPHIKADGSVVEVYALGTEPIDVVTYLRGVYDDIVTQHPRDPIVEMDEANLFEHGGNLAGQYSHQRQLFFKTDNGQFFEYAKNYINPSVHSEVFSQMQRMSEAATIMQEFGPNYAKTIDDVVAVAGNLNRVDQFLLKNTFKQITGELNHPVNGKTAETGQFIRAIGNAAFLWTSSITAMMDTVTSMSRMRWMGADFKQSTTGLVVALKDAWNRSEEDRAWFVGHTAGLDAMLGAVSRKFTGETAAGGLAKRLNQWTFKWNGMNTWNTIMQEALLDVSTKHLGEMAALEGPLPAQFVSALQRYGISETEFRVVSRYADGGRLAPDFLPDELKPTAAKLSHMLTDTINEGVLVPTASEEAILSLGTKAGTWYGESVRTILQYKSFPFALMRKTYRRMINAIGDNAGEAWSRRFFDRSAVDAYAFLGATFVMGFLVFNMKEMLKGREPVTFTDEDQRNAANVYRILRASGLLGITGETLFGNGSASDMLGPVPGQVLNTLTSDSGYRFATNATSLIPGASMPFINEGRKAFLAAILGDSAEMQRNATRKMLESKHGQSSAF